MVYVMLWSNDVSCWWLTDLEANTAEELKAHVFVGKGGVYGVGDSMCGTADVLCCIHLLRC
jgi:hypothetical protein